DSSSVRRPSSAIARRTASTSGNVSKRLRNRQVTYPQTPLPAAIAVAPDDIRRRSGTLIWIGSCQVAKVLGPAVLRGWFGGGAHRLSSTSLSRLIYAGWCRMTVCANEERSRSL